MSTFNAINLAPQDDEVEAEEHTRELQIQEGFKIYEQALMSLNEKKFEESNAKFIDLFKLDVIKPDKWGVYRYSSPILDRLRYLTYRNRGIYYYTYIQENHETMDSSDVVNNILKVVENLVEAIQHDDPDITVTNLLVQLFRGFKSNKLERLILELGLTKDTNQFLLNGRRRKAPLPQIRLLLKQYFSLLTDNDANDTKQFIISRIPFDENQEIRRDDNSDTDTLILNPILNKIKKMKTEDEDLMRSLDTFEINIEELSWISVVSSMANLLPYSKSSNLLGRNSDPYNELDEPIEAIKFIVKEGILPLKNDENKIISEPPVLSTSQSVDSETDGRCRNEEDTRKAENTDAKRNLKRPIEIDSAASRISQRSSKRFKEKETVIEEKPLFSIDEHDQFLTKYDTLLSKLSYKVPFKISDLSNDSVNSHDDLLWYNDLSICLENWNSSYTEVFTHAEIPKKKERHSNNANREEILQLNMLLKTNILEGSNDSFSSVEKLTSENLNKFIEMVNSKTPHFNEARFLLLQFLLDDNEGQRLITKFSWPDKLLKIVTSLVLGVERNLYDLIMYNKDTYWFFGLSILEILVNFLGDLCEDIQTIKPTSSRMGDLRSQKNKLERKIERWLVLLETNEKKDQTLPLGWIKYSYIQMTNEITSKLLVNSLKSLSELIRNKGLPIEIPYPNYKHISTLASNSVKSQLSKISIIQNISLHELAQNPNENQEKIKQENQEHMGVLENILVQSLNPGKDVDKTSDIEMVTFISESPFNLQAKLWEVLFLYYCNLDDNEGALRIYSNYMHLLRLGIQPRNYNNLSCESRTQKLLFVLSAAGSASLKILEYLKQNKWNMPNKISIPEHFQDIQDMFFFFYAIIFHETTLERDSNGISFSQKAVKSYALVKDYVTAIGTISVYLYCWKCFNNKSDEYNSLTVKYISLLHSFFGKQSFCDAANGIFLLLCENLICRWTIESSYEAFKQVLWCRYHHALGTGSDETEQHETKTTKMSKENAIPLGVYLMRYQYKDVNPLLSSNNKSSLKQILDNIIETVGDPVIADNHILARNEYVFNIFLEKPITVSLLKEALSGKPLLSLTTPNDDLQAGMDAGIFYMASIQTMNQYKIKKRAMQARPSDLDSIRKTLRDDILYNTGRFESWLLLGSCFSYIVEDDLTWTSDKISVPEKKKTVAHMQRKAILCYLMALSLYYRMESPSADDSNIIGRTFEALGNELVSAYYKPMDRLAFSWKFSPNVLQLSVDKNIEESETKEVMSISNFNIEQAIVLCFTRAGQYMNCIDKHNWWDDYNLGKMFFKIDQKRYYQQAYDNILKASHTCHSMSKKGKDPIIEPHYYLVNICYKMVSQDIIPPSQALELLSKDNGFLDQNSEFWTFQDSDDKSESKKILYRKIIILLKKILLEDKKKVQHRPLFRIAKILHDEFQETEKAIEEMEIMVSIKNSKNLINIWKPDFERPGKHFVYAYEYVLFYAKLCLEQNNFNALAIIIKKLRRFGSGIAYVNDAIDLTIQDYTSCVEKKYKIIDKRYVENLFFQLNYQYFLKVSKELYDDFNVNEYDDEDIDGLRYAFQLKKGNNGIAFDNVCISIYFKCFYLPKLDKFKKEIASHDETPTSIPDNVLSTPTKSDTPVSTESKLPTSPKPNGPKKRISKKEAFDRIRSLVDKFP